METLASVKTDQNIAVVQHAFEDFAKGNIAGILDACNDDVQWGSFDNPDVPFASSYSGKQGVGEFFTNLGSSIDYENFQTDSFYGDKDMVFVVGNHKATVKATGKKFGHDFLMQFRVRDGKLSNFFAWIDTRDQGQAFQSSGAKTAVIQELYGKFGVGNIPGMLDQLTDDVVWDVTRNVFIADPRVYKGKEDVMKFFLDIASSVRIPVFQPLSFSEHGDAVYVNGKFEMDVIRENKSIKLDWTMRWKFRGDKIYHFAEYFAPVE